ncbi:MAG: Eco47II family restriction endonuclease [Cyclobacteriaceae bacterium]|nr:Eco47II family restriction endonuclease [Cyclobacteriaceae bacterium]UYN86672.1 MAG: Eco47II family restriction endonuclease [Cyclobacteriaceae bacterium]
MPFLSWINDANLKDSVGFLLSKAKEARDNAEGNFGKNVVDPFSALFEIAGFSSDFETWYKSETTRQAQKTLQNHVGDFHQNILGAVNGWENMKKGQVIDLVSFEKKIVAEIKNKYNTISGGKLSDLYSSLDNLVMPKASIYKNFTAYYVAIVPKYPVRYNKPFTPSNKDKGEKCAANEKVREIDGASFYTLATGDPNALENLFDVLPDVIKICSDNKYTITDRDKLKAFFSTAFGQPI